MQAAPEPGAFRFVDPDGLRGEPEYDPDTRVREALGAGDALQLGRRRARFHAHLSGCDAQKVSEWGFVERVSTGLLCLQEGHTDWAADFLRVAAAWATEPGDT